MGIHLYFAVFLPLFAFLYLKKNTFNNFASFLFGYTISGLVAPFALAFIFLLMSTFSLHHINGLLFFSPILMSLIGAMFEFKRKEPRMFVFGLCMFSINMIIFSIINYNYLIG